MSAVNDLEAALQAMLSLKAPGVSGTKIASITKLCIANIQSESVLVQKIYTHFKKAPGTHKLGVLYVVDSVTRQWVDLAKKAGQPTGTAAGDGTYAAGVNRVTELLPVLMTDILQHAPEDQKEKIKKLVDIWERGNTFPAPLLASFQEKIKASQNTRTTTPPGSPPAVPPQGHGQQQPSNSTAPVPNTIMEMLANLAKQNTAAPAPSNAPQQDNSNYVSNPQNSYPLQVPTSVNQAPQFPAAAQALNVQHAGAHVPSQYPGNNLNGAVAPAIPNVQATGLGALASMTPQPSAMGPEAIQQQLMLIQVLMAQGVPQEQWGPIIAALSGGASMAGVAPVNVAGGNAASQWPAMTAQNAQSAQNAQNIQNGWNNRNDVQSRDANSTSDSHRVRSPTNRYQHRSRSRSPPAWGRDREPSPPRRRDSPIYGEYHGEAQGNGSRGDSDRRGRGRGGRARGNEYRQRSPPPTRHRSVSPASRGGAPGGGQKFLEWDHSIGKDNIKVLSRTLFVGGVTCPEDELRKVFSRFGHVQTCIVNQDKRHGFVKMISREDALKAKEGMENFKPSDMQLRTRWGVGFGPRDCSDYQTGISIIPIGRLTEADRKWMLTAEYGGSGGRQIEGGMIVEEPDIEIGAGVSSKAISRRMATDQGGRTGPRSTRINNDGGAGGAGGAGAGRFRRGDRQDGPDRESVNAIGVPPAVPGFGFPLGNMNNGMPMIPSFMFPGGTTQQPPAPGQN